MQWSYFLLLMSCLHKAFLVAIGPNWYRISQLQSSLFHTLNKRANHDWKIWSWSDSQKCLVWIEYNKCVMPKKNAALYIDKTAESACYVADDLLTLYPIRWRWKALVTLTLPVCNLFNTCYCRTLIFILYHGILTHFFCSLCKTCRTPPPPPPPLPLLLLPF